MLTDPDLDVLLDLVLDADADADADPRSPTWAPSPGLAVTPGPEHELLAHLSEQSRHDFSRFSFGERRPLRALAVHHPIEDQAVQRPDEAAVIGSDGSVLSYGELGCRATHLADRLRRLGVRRGDRVGLFLTRGPEMVVGILAVLKAGAAWVPQDVRHTPGATLAHIAEVAELRVVLTTRQYADSIPPGVRDVLSIDALPDPDDAAEPGPTGAELRARRPTDAKPHDPAVVIFTSGTTGRPNGVAVTHANLVNTLLDGPGALGIEPGMRVAQLLNIAFDMAVWEILGALTHGATLVIRGDDLQVTASGVDVIIATPSVLARLRPEACRGVRIVAVAGERCPESLARTWSQSATFHNSCGPTEVTIVNTVHRYRAGEELTIGAPLPNTSAYVLDEDLRPVETGQVGEMWAGGACVTRGYLRNPTLTAERYRPDPFTGGLMFRTRDLVSWTPQGRLLHHGRTDDQVKVRGGFRVELDAVTTALERAPGVRAATTLFVDGGLVGVVATSGADASATAATARDGVAADLPYYYVPERMLTVTELPLTPRGKVDKRNLLARLSPAEGAA